MPILRAIVFCSGRVQAQGNSITGPVVGDQGVGHAGPEITCEFSLPLCLCFPYILLHIRITWGDFKHPSAQVAAQIS